MSIVFNNIRINSISSGSGVFAGYNRQYFWSSSRNACLGYGVIAGEENLLEAPCNVVTDADISDCMLESLEEFIYKKLEG
ncbi:MAG TPA: hypothetical protein VN549_07845 [Negativicutes bacterium]|nr:hypothetical protein [Negativicutes bacterium]